MRYIGDMAHIRWKLEAWLREHGMTRYELAQAMSGNTQSRQTTLYRMSDPKRVDLNVLGEIIAALRRETGDPVSVCDLLEYE